MLQLFENPWKDQDYYREQWRAYYIERARRLTHVGISLGGIGALGLLFALFPESFLQRHSLFAGVVAVIGGLLWLTLIAQWIMFNWKMSSWTCPRCGEPFFTSAFVRNPFGRRCRHCKLLRLKRSDIGATPSA